MVLFVANLAEATVKLTILNRNTSYAQSASGASLKPHY